MVYTTQLCDVVKYLIRVVRLPRSIQKTRMVIQVRCNKDWRFSGCHKLFEYLNSCQQTLFITLIGGLGMFVHERID